MTDLVYRSRDGSGNPVYSDRPLQDHRDTQPHEPGRSEEERRQNYEDAKLAIKEAQKRIPKAYDYWQYLQFLRSHDPLRWDRVMRELMREDPQTWLKLQKHPQFQPLRRTMLGVKAAEKHLAAGVGLVTGKWGGSIEKWLETAVQEEMKRHSWGPYADVLGGKATTLPTKAASYSSSRLGRYMKVEEPKLAAAGKAAAKELDASRAAIRTGVATGISRVGGVLVDGGMQMLDAERASDIGKEALRLRARTLFERGVIDVEQWAQSQELLSQGRYVAMRQLLDDAASQYIREGR